RLFVMVAVSFKASNRDGGIRHFAIRKTAPPSSTFFAGTAREFVRFEMAIGCGSISELDEDVYFFAEVKYGWDYSSLDDNKNAHDVFLGRAARRDGAKRV